MLSLVLLSLIILNIINMDNIRESMEEDEDVKLKLEEEEAEPPYSRRQLGGHTRRTRGGGDKS